MDLASKIAERVSSLQKFDQEIAALREKRMVAEIELRVYREVFAGTAPTEAGTAPTEATPAEHNANGIQQRKRGGPKNLGEVWKTVFTGLVTNAPQSYSLSELKALVPQAGEQGDSFRVAAWHHVQRGNMDKGPNGEYRANRKTAEAIGINWSPEKEHGGSTGAVTPAAGNR